MKVGDLVRRMDNGSPNQKNRSGHYAIVYAIRKRDKVTGYPISVSLLWDDGLSRNYYRARLLEVINGTED